ncbi:MAG: hypothetical protein ACJAT8_002082 [Cellvibrionaceae bacterium]|jgi:hypothetical protein
MVKSSGDINRQGFFTAVILVKSKRHNKNKLGRTAFIRIKAPTHNDMIYMMQ